MIQYFVEQGGIFLGRMIQAEPGIFIGPISRVLGAIINFLYGVVYFITPVGALGIAIILITIMVRTALLPTGFKMMRNTMKMRAMKPEMDKIKEKYGGTKDPELRRKMNAEMQALNAKHGVNMLASCLPMLVTWPLFIALFSVLSNAFLFVGSVTEAYSALSHALINQGADFLSDVVAPLAERRVPQGMTINIMNVTDLNRVIHVFDANDWSAIFYNLSGADYTHIHHLYESKMAIQSFIGLNLIEPAGTNWPGVILPVLSAGTMLLSQFLMTRSNPSVDEQSKTIQRVTMIIFPLMFGWFTIGAPAGVGLYWVVLNLFMIAQHYLIMNYYKRKDSKADAKAA